MEFGTLNYTVLITYLLAMVAIGIAFAGRQKNTEDYFLAGRRMPWLVVAMSMYASLTSAVTYMGLPGMAYAHNTALLAVCMVSPVLAPFLIMLFYPFYRRLHVTTSYEYIDRRFGAGPRMTISALFLLARLGWLGTVIFAPALALSVVTGIELTYAILLMGLLATLYTMLGGMSAVLWTDVAQFIILVFGAIWIAFTLVAEVPDGVAGILELARSTHRINFDWSLSITEMTMGGVAIGFFFQMMQDYGTDQVTVQRLLSARHNRGMVKAIIFNAGTDFLIIPLLLFIGLGLFAFYQGVPGGLPQGLTNDQILPHYIMNSLPAGLSGLMVAAIFAAAMSSMDSGINSMATVVVNDFIQPHRKTKSPPENDVRLARILTLVLGIFATGVAFYVSRLEGLIQAFATFMSLFSAPVLALFLLGMLTRHGRFSAWVVGAIFSIPFTWWVQQHTGVNWVYYFPLSFAASFAVSLVLSGIIGLFKGPATDNTYTIWGRRNLEQTK